MKIALCFAGQPRSVEQGYEYYKKNLLDHFDVDVYVHAWNSELNQTVLDLYKPVAYKFEDPLVGIDCSRYIRTPIPLKHPQIAVYSMYYSLNEVRKLVAGEYDWVIKSRTDYAMNIKPQFETLDNSKVYIPDCYIAPERDVGNDQFAFGSKETMMKYMATFENLDKYYDEGSVFNGENFMQANLREHNLYGDNLEYIHMNNPFQAGPWNGGTHSLIRDDILKWK